MKRVWILLSVGAFIMCGVLTGLVFGTEVHNDGGAAYRCNEECEDQVSMSIPRNAYPEFRNALEQCVINSPTCPEHAKRMARENFKNRQKSKSTPPRQWTEIEKMEIHNQRCHVECKRKSGYREPMNPTDTVKYMRFMNQCTAKCEKR